MKCIVFWDLLSLSFLQNLKKGFKLREISKSYKWKVTLKGFKLPEIPKSYKWKITLKGFKLPEIPKSYKWKVILDDVKAKNCL